MNIDLNKNYFHQVLRQNLKHKGKRIVFIHGVGDGILAQAIRKEFEFIGEMNNRECKTLALPASFPGGKSKASQRKPPKTRRLKQADRCRC